MFRFDRAAMAGPLTYSHGIARFRAGSVMSPPPASAAIGTAPPRRASTRTANRFIVPSVRVLRREKSYLARQGVRRNLRVRDDEDREAEKRSGDGDEAHGPTLRRVF